MNTNTNTKTSKGNAPRVEKIDFPKGLLESLGFEAIDQSSIGSLSTELAKYQRALGLAIQGIKDLQAQRDELLAALRKAQPMVFQWEHRVCHGKTELADEITSLIAKHEGRAQ